MALFVSSLEATPAVCVDIDSWLVMLVDSAGLKLGGIDDGLMSECGQRNNMFHRLWWLSGGRVDVGGETTSFPGFRKVSSGVAK